MVTVEENSIVLLIKSEVFDLIFMSSLLSKHFRIILYSLKNGRVDDTSCVLNSMNNYYFLYNYTKQIILNYKFERLDGPSSETTGPIS